MAPRVTPLGGSIGTGLTLLGLLRSVFWVVLTVGAGCGRFPGGLSSCVLGWLVAALCVGLCVWLVWVFTE
jgi:hypothetical protein